MSVDTAQSLRLSRTVQATPQRAWDAWTRPEHMKRWACPAPDGVRDVTADLRVGGSYTLVMEVDGQRYTAFGTYEEIDEPNRLVYTWDWKEADHAVGETRVTVEFEARGDATEITLVHDGFPAVEAKEAHEEGWGACLAHYEALLA